MQSSEENIPVDPCSSVAKIKPKLTARRRETLVAYLYLLPAGLPLVVFGLFPILFAFYISLFDWRLKAEKFVGFLNYWRAVTSREFWHSMLVTVYYALCTVPTSLILSFLLATLLFQGVRRGRGAYRTVFFLPYVTSTVAAAMVWVWIFHPEYGVANYLLKCVGLPTARWLLDPRGVLDILGAAVGINVPDWAGGPSLALVVVASFSIWHALGFETVIFLAGLSNIPHELYEVADLDGARWTQRTLKITVPLLSPTIFFLCVVSTIRSFQAFNHIYVMTGGGPLDSTKNVTMYIFSNFYEYTRVGYGATVALLLFVTILGLTALQFRFARERVFY